MLRKQKQCEACAAHSAHIEYLTRQNQDLMDRLQEMIGQIHYNQVAANTARLEAELPGKLYTTEDDEDARALATRDDGTVDTGLMQALLAHADFDNTEIEFA